MKREETKTMLLLPIAVIAAIIGITIYACSADDEFETNYEMETLASSQMERSLEPLIVNYLESPELSAQVIFTYIPFIDQIIDPDTTNVSLKIRCHDDYTNFCVSDFQCDTIVGGEVGALVYRTQNVGNSAFNVTVVFPISKTVVSPYTHQDTIVTTSPSKQFFIYKSDLQ